ncbi:MSMEG_4193 family putative phosphomutase [Flexivirga sp. ID2601S]|uniref:MSMEG_4193 family putative phosphomutase n=1 Tax=Flexivirga aerilata TaxID=1656889 RepID=A0A849ARW2_9MICO|nr:MSMEG_4193 family putative phosphomutase [Flexivirga aerilata]NNG41020.1 MSMEG_4193 family putative phosphomutase [Flexivirga aerilata]
MPTVLLVRHGRTTANTSGVLAGWTPGIGLDETGREQVQRLGDHLAGLPIVRVVSSPLQRCQETAAAILAARDGGEVVTDDRLGECRYGGWTGGKISDLTKDPLWRTVQDHPSAVTFPPSDTFEHESLREMSARAVAAVRDTDAAIGAEHGERALWVAVSHGDVIKAVLADALGTGLDAFQRIVAGPASVSVVQYTARRPFVLRLNDNLGQLRDLVTAPPASGDATPGGVTGNDAED